MVCMKKNYIPGETFSSKANTINNTVENNISGQSDNNTQKENVGGQQAPILNWKFH